MKQLPHVLVATLALAALCATSHAAVKPASLFTDNMVLQQGQPIPVWGTAAPGEKVTVKFRDQTVSTQADESGHWKLELVSIKATPDQAPASLTIESTDSANVTSQLVLNNVVVGEVWLCSGQSNMYHPVCKSLNPEAEEAAANFPGIRLFTIDQATAPVPQETSSGRWLVCSPTSVGTFSGVGYFFAKKLHQELGVPVGMIHSSWGGSPIVPWTPLETLKETKAAGETARTFEKERDLYLADAKKYQEILAEGVKKREADLAAYDARVFAQDVGHLEHWSTGVAGSGSWKAADMPLATSVLGSYCGSAWCKRLVTVPEAWVGQALKFNFGSIDEADEVYVNGTLIGETHDNSLWQTPRHYTIPATLVTNGPLTIVVRVMNQVGVMGVGGAESDFSIQPVDTKIAGDSLPLAKGWTYAMGSPLSFSDRPVIPMPTVPGDGWNASTIYNAMIAPLVPYGMKGVLWYQGESDSGAWEAYSELLPAMIGGWRAAWKQPSFDFLIVQLANLYAPQSNAIELASMADIRDVQRKALAMPGTGLAVALDAGQWDEVHYPNKQAVGLRLALWALGKTYGRTDIVPSGPLYKSMAIENDKAIVSFDYIGSGLAMHGNELASFAIAGEDHVFYKAQAEIEGDTVVVHSAKVPHPLAVRYAWAANPACSLYNKEGLPASSFRTDDWPYVKCGD